MFQNLASRNYGCCSHVGYLKEPGHRVLVANPRMVSAICQNVRKSDSDDSDLLARIARADEKLRYPVEHVSEGMQRDLRPGCCEVCGT